MTSKSYLGQVVLIGAGRFYKSIFREFGSDILRIMDINLLDVHYLRGARPEGGQPKPCFVRSVP